MVVEWGYDHCSCNQQFKPLQFNPTKNFRASKGFETIVGLCVSAQCSTSWVINTYTVGAVKFVGFI